MRILMTSLACFSLLFAACGDDDDDGDGTTIDGSTPTIDGGGDPTLDCATYCTTIAANCTGDNAQYGAVATSCTEVCGTFAEGALGDTTGNTLGCRLYHAGAAAGNPDLHCIHAGPTGGGTEVDGTTTFCGDPCISFCNTALDECTGKTNGQFGGDMDTCLEECAAFAAEPVYSANEMSGDTFACRMYHLTVAASSEDNATTHCPHIATKSATCAAAP